MVIGDGTGGEVFENHSEAFHETVGADDENCSVFGVRMLEVLKEICGASVKVTDRFDTKGARIEGDVEKIDFIVKQRRGRAAFELTSVALVEASVNSNLTPVALRGMSD